jgi:hypothetical protein
MPRPLYPQGKSPWYPLDTRVGGPHSQSGRGGAEKNSHFLPVLEPPIIHSIAQRYTTELSRLLPHKGTVLLNSINPETYQGIVGVRTVSPIQLGLPQMMPVSSTLPSRFGLCTLSLHVGFSVNRFNLEMLSGSLSPRHGASSGSGWRRRPPDMEGSCEYIV